MILLSLLLLSFSLEHLLGDVYHPWNHLSPLCRTEEGALSSKSSILNSMENDYIYIFHHSLLVMCNRWRYPCYVSVGEFRIV
jgi:hypothetical protein